MLIIFDVFKNTVAYFACTNDLILSDKKLEIDYKYQLNNLFL